jgi:predicted transcriptional regulator
MNYITKEDMHALIAELRDMAPNVPLSYGQSIALARMQAARIREWITERLGRDDATMNLIWLLKQRLVPVHFVPAYRLGENTSGLTTDEVDGSLQVFINEAEPRVRQRFSLLHEFKHVLDFDNSDILHSKLGWGNVAMRKQMVESVANEFAAHVLMPSVLVKRAWFELHDLPKVARLFTVSVEAMGMRLEKLNILGKPKPTPRAFFRHAGILPELDTVLADLSNYFSAIA